jgi:phosphate transport system protein
MTKHFHSELEKIKKKILSLGALIEDQMHLASKAIKSRDADIARQIIYSDNEIDDMEVEIEEECLKVLALHQPVAVDLRFIIVVIKINNELERIGDQAVNIAERVEILAKKDHMGFIFDYTPMIEKAEFMLKKSLDALVNFDLNMAMLVRVLDDDVDKMKDEAYDQIKNIMKEYPGRIGYLINLFLISRHIERIADHATNIAEEVIYLIEGEIVRHASLNER